MSSTDLKISSIAFGFTLGFGYLTAWDAWKITRKNRNPLRSLFIYMVWGELIVNLIIAIVAWLFLEGTVKPIFITYFLILCLWVFEIQFILQIIVNRVAIITTDRRLVTYIRWATVIFISLINISVFCIWIPAQMEVSDTFVRINNIWDKITKVLIGLNDACLNLYFINQVRKRLIANGLQKYNALASFNTRIILISIGMDLLIIGTMFLKNGAVFLQFHPIAYTVKLKIELSMTNLITRISQESVRDRVTTSTTNKYNHTNSRFRGTETQNGKAVPLSVFAENQQNNTTTQVTAQNPTSEATAGNAHQIYQKMEYTVQVSDVRQQSDGFPPSERSSSRGSKEDGVFPHTSKHDDEEPLAWRG